MKKNPFLTNMWEDKDIEFTDTLEGEEREGFLSLGAYYFEKKETDFDGMIPLRFINFAAYSNVDDVDYQSVDFDSMVHVFFISK